MLLPAIFFAVAANSIPFSFGGKSNNKNTDGNQKVSLQQEQAAIINGKPRNTQTPKPSITKFRKLSFNQAANIPIEFPTDTENSNNLADEIKNQLTSTPMIVFYSVLSLCIIIAIGIFMFYKDPEDEGVETTQDAVIEHQLQEVLDSKLENETMVI
ncbi:hypothetical protein TVAG_103400 [Trichomonas vaginalis G3]|uniref:Uncharacterized protein n=1 Tax=Trichomonas vaginalis (strain ATCC PRA-98 / G3) TaxID=412133 RepID=A2EKQ1_TRIV3|nr:hypothetical protein TVAGG3_0931220 [Trichomonas vaginalis G3]EAY06790.1 hypothetical protein TVAG_103400 [Trichomonas vaginalis G3]KAI5485850.1 hypothetical protein TVAGG3_0931220 [Trichomonas vaginalis G3]|eukprot:XP_001319013.1 hypothetical protein [Trichomonas vaginalis G3]